MPDITAEVRLIADQETVWSEWEMRGTRQDGSPHLMRGVVIFGVDRGEATWARFYLEPVEEGGGDVDETIRRAVVVSSNTDAASAPNRSGSNDDPRRRWKWNPRDQIAEPVDRSRAGRSILSRNPGMPLRRGDRVQIVPGDVRDTRR